MNAPPASRPVKIAFLGVKAIPAPGGICTYAEETAARLTQRGYDVTVYCRRAYLSELGPGRLPSHREVRRRLTPGLRGKHCDALSHTFTAALDSLFRDYDLVHIHGSAPAAVAPLLRLRPRRPVVVTVHGLDWQGAKWGGLSRRLMRAAAQVPVRFASEVVVVSRSLQRAYRELFGRETTYIPSGASLPPLRPAREITERWGLLPGRYVLFVGRLTPDKGLEYLLQAQHALPPDYRLVLVGGANYRDPYLLRLSDLAGDQILFTGYQQGDTLAELFSNAALYIQPSVQEALPLALLEALSYGRCVLASDLEGNCEALGGCGHTFPAGDSDGLAALLSDLLSDSDGLEAQFPLAREHIAREHNWDRTTEAHDQLYRRLLNQSTFASE